MTRYVSKEMDMPTVLTIKQAAPLLKVGEQAVREMIKAGLIPGAGCYKSETGKGKNNTYYITLEQIENMQKGV